MSTKMSSFAAIESESDKVQCCASCGIAGVDEIKLKDCSACHLVKYCGVSCQKEHRPQHKRECKKRAAELRDDILFKQPESTHDGDCPICCLSLPIDASKSDLMTCCCKRLCNGCHYANIKREYAGKLDHKCAFCRESFPNNMEESNDQLMKRIEANDPVAMSHMGTKRHLKGDFKSSFEYWTRAAALGDALAHYQVSVLYRTGEGAAVDKKKALYHLEQAAIGGHPLARHTLGCKEAEDGRVDMAVKHFIIAAKLGLDNSLRNLKQLYTAGHVSKDDFAAALRGHQAAIDATKSPQREEAAYHRGL